MKFLRANWVWIVLPLAVVASIAAAIWLLGGEPAPKDVYTIF